MQIGVMGVGYVGLVTAAGLAETGNFVIGYDIDQAKIARLRRGELPFMSRGWTGLWSGARARTSFISQSA